MANYPIKVLVDEKGQEFIPISSTGALLDPTGQNLDTILASKLETNSIIAGSGITLNKNTTTIVNKKIIIVAHGNSLRGLIKYLDNIKDFKFNKKKYIWNNNRISIR